jgi:hypothetical protein
MPYRRQWGGTPSRASARSSSSPPSPSSSAMGGCTGVGQHVGQARGQFSVAHFSSLLMRSSASPLLPGVAVSGGVGGGKGSPRGTRLHGGGAQRRRRNGADLIYASDGSAYAVRRRLAARFPLASAGLLQPCGRLRKLRSGPRRGCARLTRSPDISGWTLRPDGYRR